MCARERADNLFAVLEELSGRHGKKMGSTWEILASMFLVNRLEIKRGLARGHPQVSLVRGRKMRV